MSGSNISPTSSGPKRSRAAQAALALLGATLATLLGLVAYVVIGMIARPLAVGVQGIGLCAALGAAAGAALQGLGSRKPRIACGFLGGLVGGYFTVFSGEAYPPGTIDWAVKGGAIGAAFALPVVLVMAVLIELGHVVSSRASRRAQKMLGEDQP
jgi:hypothetical protein